VLSVVARFLTDALVLAATVLAWPPVVMFTFGLWWMYSDIFEGPAYAQPGKDDPDYARRFGQFEALSFRPVGMTREVGWFISPLTWLRRSLQGTRWMRTADGLMLATFHRLHRSEPVRFGVMTLNNGGGLVRTTSPGKGRPVAPTSKYARFEVGLEPAELVARHRENVETFCRERGLVSVPATFREAAAAALALDRLATKGRPRGGVAEDYREVRDTRLGSVLMVMTAVMATGNVAAGPVPASESHGYLKLMGMLVLAELFVAIFVIGPISRHRHAARARAGSVGRTV
jgi:hypothetical protein